MKFISAIALVLATLPFMVSAAATDAAACRAFCCDAVVPGVRPAGNVGSEQPYMYDIYLQADYFWQVNCSAGGLDCGFHGQVTACCVRFGSLGATSGAAIGCQ
ncbi:hypothetical protein CVT25_015903 [Psilocybe cyanescens]|uniref:Hydrophobin n=1 Tax=Psilocybe cyanescens TaxID=93625 RepID=A0A409WSA1_PSICY|nr:hypothetical protein CVT25_015903 [Psilocybe cyanescens]